MRANYGGRYDKKEKKMDKSTKQMVEKLIDATFADDMMMLSQPETQHPVKRKGKKQFNFIKDEKENETLD